MTQDVESAAVPPETPEDVTQFSVPCAQETPLALVAAWHIGHRVFVRILHCVCRIAPFHGI